MFSSQVSKHYIKMLNELIWNNVSVQSIDHVKDDLTINQLFERRNSLQIKDKKNICEAYKKYLSHSLEYISQ